MTAGPSPETFVDTILALFARRGGDHYGETVTQLDHALQTAHHARSEGQADALVAAALLHDIGHLLQKHGEDAADRGVDALHERIGAAWLAQGLGPEVTEPVRLHVDAKRYLALREPGAQRGRQPEGGERCASRAISKRSAPPRARAWACRAVRWTPPKPRRSNGCRPSTPPSGCAAMTSAARPKG